MANEITVDLTVFEDVQDSVEALGEYPTPDEVADALDAIREAIQMLAETALDVVRKHAPREEGYSKGYWYAHITTALSDDHGYLGGSMGPLSSTIKAIRGEEEED